MMKLGRYEYAFPVCLAPMAGFTDVSFRTLCREFGADMVCTEMLSAKGLVYGSAETASLYRTNGRECPVAVQLFGREPDYMAEAARRIERELGEGLLCIDLNMGCPAPKIYNNGEGSALMDEPKLAAEIIRATVGAVNVPVTVKCRIGRDEAHIVAVPFAKMCADAGAAMLTVHGRTRRQMCAGRADMAVVAAVKRAVDIPVIANGDIASAADARRVLDETGADGVMIGRAALGNPWLFGEIRAALRGKPYQRPTGAERRALALCHAEMTVADKGAHGMIEMRKHLACYVRGMPGAAELRVRINACKNLDELREILA